MCNKSRSRRGESAKIEKSVDLGEKEKKDVIHLDISELLKYRNKA